MGRFKGTQREIQRNRERDIEGLREMYPPREEI